MDIPPAVTTVSTSPGIRTIAAPVTTSAPALTRIVFRACAVNAVPAGRRAVTPVLTLLGIRPTEGSVGTRAAARRPIASMGHARNAPMDYQSAETVVLTSILMRTIAAPAALSARRTAITESATTTEAEVGMEGTAAGTAGTESAYWQVRTGCPRARSFGSRVAHGVSAQRRERRNRNDFEEAVRTRRNITSKPNG
jgi:hypothetical protein